MLRLSKLTDYAVVVMARLARDGALPDGQVQTAPGLALATGIAEPTVSKVLKSLGRPAWSKASAAPGAAIA